MKTAVVVVLLVIVIALVGYDVMLDRPRGFSATSVPAMRVAIAGTVPVLVVDPGTIEREDDPPLTRAARDYLRRAASTLPGLWDQIADRIERGEITDKAGAIRHHGQLALPLNKALDDVFKPGLDDKGMIVNKAVIVNALRQGAAALTRQD